MSFKVRKSSKVKKLKAIMFTDKTNPWMDRPNHGTLSREQQQVYGLSLEENLMINGAAGCGKTILAIMRAEQLVKKKKKVLFITYTKILHQFTEIAAEGYGLINEGEDKNIDIRYTSDMAKQAFGRHMINLNSLTDKMIARLIAFTGNFDHVIIDEGQDFDVKVYHKIFKKLGNVHTVCSDRKQSLYESDFSPYAIKTVYSPMDEHVLDFTYRNPKNILRTSMGFYINRFRNSPTELIGTKVKLYNDYPGEVTLIHTINEINTIATLIKNRAENTVGILLPNNAAVKLFYDALEDRNLEDIEYKYYIGGTGENTCDFENTRPKIMTYHSAKGIQFDSVIIPLLDGNYSDEIRFSNEPEEARAFYVAMTRTRKNLYFTMPPEAICPYYEVVPKDYIKIVQRDEDPTPTVDDLFEIPKADDIIDFGEEDD